jgi:hypothetical protein
MSSQTAFQVKICIALAIVRECATEAAIQDKHLATGTAFVQLVQEPG